MTNSIRKALLCGVSLAATSGALLASPSFAGTEPGAEQLRLESQAAPQVAQGYGSSSSTVDVVEVESVNGWYLTLGAGAAWPSAMGWQTSDLFPGDEPSGDFHFGGGFSADGGVGYDFGAVRAELTYGYTRSSLNEVNVNNSDWNFNGSGIINKNDVMGSLYWDIDTNSRFTPYIGGGIGYTNLSTPSITVDGYRTDSASRGLFGWQAKVGVSYALAYNWDLYAEGTYSGAGGSNNNLINLASYNDFGAKLGFRYRFAQPEAVVVVPEPAPAPAPAPAPIPAPEPAPEPAPIRGLW